MFIFQILQETTKKFKDIQSSSVFCVPLEPFEKTVNKSVTAGLTHWPNKKAGPQIAQGTMQMLMVWKETQVSPPERRSTWQNRKGDPRYLGNGI